MTVSTSFVTFLWDFLLLCDLSWPRGPTDLSFIMTLENGTIMFQLNFVNLIIIFGIGLHLFNGLKHLLFHS